MLQQHTRTTRGLGPVVALGLAIAAINPATGLAKPAAEPLPGSVSQKSAISQNLVTPDARDAGAAGSAGTVSSQNLVSPDARDAAAVSSASKSLVAPDTRDAADGVVVSSPKLAPGRRRRPAAASRDGTPRSSSGSVPRS